MFDSVYNKHKIMWELIIICNAIKLPLLLTRIDVNKRIFAGDDHFNKNNWKWKIDTTKEIAGERATGKERVCTPSQLIYTLKTKETCRDTRFMVVKCASVVSIARLREIIYRFIIYKETIIQRQTCLLFGIISEEQWTDSLYAATTCDLQEFMAALPTKDIRSRNCHHCFLFVVCVSGKFKRGVIGIWN